MKLQCIHAHFDDFEFTCGGLFTLTQRRDGVQGIGEVVICTDGTAGHHRRTRVETGRMRLVEQLASARLGGYRCEQLRLPDGSIPRDSCLMVDVPLLASLWHAIRRCQPDYLIAPPVINDPLAGIHIDHLAVAEAVRKVAYLINVPHAYLPEYPADETVSAPCTVPVVLNAYDHYFKKANAFDLAIDIEDAFDLVCEMGWCHQSQITEWLPWVGAPFARPAPASLAAWKDLAREECLARNAAFGIGSRRAFEYFSVTSWGRVPTLDALISDLPGLSLQHSRLEQLRRRLEA
jgi:LmbE family N-acetylglucosaminyl deacetylase